MSVDAGLLAQYAVIALAVLLSAAYVARKQFPHAVRRARIALAVSMVRDARPAWLRRFGGVIAPAPTAAGSSCGGCNGCD